MSTCERGVICSELNLLHCRWRGLPQVTLLSRQKYACRDERMLVETYIFVATNRILLRKGKTRLLSRQKYACRDKYLSLQRFCRGKHTFVATKDVLCCDKRVFVATKMCLSRQKWYLWQLPPMILHNVAKGQPASRQMSLAAVLLITTAQISLQPKARARIRIWLDRVLSGLLV